MFYCKHNLISLAQLKISDIKQYLLNSLCYGNESISMKFPCLTWVVVAYYDCLVPIASNNDILKELPTDQSMEIFLLVIKICIRMRLAFE